MVPAKSWSAPPVLEDGFSMFNIKSVNALNKIIYESKADILLTTSHKGRYSIEKWRSIFKNRGINLNGLNRLPNNYNNLSRLEEITNWYSTSYIAEEFVVIDDDKSLNDFPHYLKKRLVLTKPLIGLTSLHVDDSLRILNTPLELI